MLSLSSPLQSVKQGMRCRFVSKHAILQLVSDLAASKPGNAQPADIMAAMDVDDLHDLDKSECLDFLRHVFEGQDKTHVLAALGSTLSAYMLSLKSCNDQFECGLIPAHQMTDWSIAHGACTHKQFRKCPAQNCQPCDTRLDQLGTSCAGCSGHRFKLPSINLRHKLKVSHMKMILAPNKLRQLQTAR